MTARKSPLPYDLKFENRPGYLHALVTGDEDSLDISRSIWNEVAKEATRVDAENVMLEEDITQGLSMADVFQLATEVARMGFGGRRVAFVDSHLDQAEVHAFGELVAQNRGWNGRVFNDAAAAESWLLGRSDK